MENYKHDEYRDNLAGLVKSTPDREERKEILEANSQTKVYKENKEIHLEDIQIFKDRRILPIDEITERVRNSSHLQKVFFGKSYAKEEVEKWSQKGLNRSIINSIVNRLVGEGKTLEAAELYEREAPLNNFPDLKKEDENFWFKAGRLREMIRDYEVALKDYLEIYNDIKEKIANLTETEIKSDYVKLNHALDSIVFDMARCYSKLEDDIQAKELLRQRALELEKIDTNSFTYYKYYEILSQLLILAGEEGKAKEILAPLKFSTMSSAGPKPGVDVSTEKKMSDMYGELQSRGYVQDLETGEWTQKKID